MREVEPRGSRGWPRGPNQARARPARGGPSQNRAVDFLGWPWGGPDWDWMEVPDGVPDPRKARCAVFLLGPLRVFRDGEAVVGGWRLKSLELLAYLGVHPHGVSKDQILEALWPEGDPKETQKYLWRAVSDLRCRLQSAPFTQVVNKAGDLYRLDFTRVWVDSFAFEVVLRLASRVAKPEKYLRIACDLYKGHFCEDRYFSWAVLVTERMKTVFIGSAKSLASHIEDNGDHDGALSILDRAIEVDPFDEDLCRRAMAMESYQNRVDLIARRYRRLRRVLLTDLEIEPSNETTREFERLARPDADGSWRTSSS